jgi:hypothetical protein
VEPAFSLLAFLVQVMELALHHVRTRSQLYLELVFYKAKSFQYGEKGISLAAARPAGMSDSVEAVCGHEVGEPPFSL